MSSRPVTRHRRVFSWISPTGLTVLALSACSAGPAASPTSQAPPPGWLNLTSTPMVAGVESSLTAGLAPNGEEVIFFITGGLGPVPACPGSLGGACLDIHGPLFVERAIPVVQSQARFTFTVPSTVAHGTEVYVQAAVQYAGTWWFTPVVQTAVQGRATDTDMDGLVALQEHAIGTDPLSADTDGDGLDDLAEIQAGTHPLLPDSDGDLLYDGDEISPWGTDPLVPDTDGDGLLDGHEVLIGSDPTGVDGDGDGLSDAYEVRVSFTNPGQADTDFDSCPDGLDAMPLLHERDEDGDGAIGSCDPCPTSAPDDQDADGVCDDVDRCFGFDDAIDTDGDSIPDGCDICNDPLDVDRDGDGVPDACDPCPHDALDDPDGDGRCGVPQVAFVSSLSFQGDLGGLTGADALCQQLADASPHTPGTYVAMLGTFRIIDRRQTSSWLESRGVDGPWVSSTGEPILDDLSDLNQLHTPISMTEHQQYRSTRVWTGLRPDGTSAANCQGFQTSLDITTGVYGQSGFPFSSWILSDAQSCNDLAALYCFGVPDVDGDRCFDHEDDDLYVAHPDRDSDGWGDDCDDCPDAYGEHVDSDGDGLCEESDPCPNDPTNVDSDGDGVCDLVDLCPSDPADTDTDGDGQCDDLDPCPQDAPDDPDEDGFCGESLRVFVSSVPVAGDEPMGAGGADLFCASLAAPRLGGNWVAWLSDDDSTAVSRLVAAGANRSYRLIDGTPISQNIELLAVLGPDNPIDRTENDEVVPDPRVWTGTSADSTASGVDCDNWSSRDAADQGTLGDARSVTNWSADTVGGCSGMAHLYCFEVP